MNARSAEFLATAQQRLRTAATIVDQDPAAALSAAYYAALYAARGALSEQDVQSPVKFFRATIACETATAPHVRQPRPIPLPMISFMISLVPP